MTVRHYFRGSQVLISRLYITAPQLNLCLRMLLNCVDVVGSELEVFYREKCCLGRKALRMPPTLDHIGKRVFSSPGGPKIPPLSFDENNGEHRRRSREHLPRPWRAWAAKKPQINESIVKTEPIHEHQPQKLLLVSPDLPAMKEASSVD